MCLNVLFNILRQLTHESITFVFSLRLNGVVVSVLLILFSYGHDSFFSFTSVLKHHFDPPSASVSTNCATPDQPNH